MLPQQVAQACGFYVFPGQYRFWLLQPDLTNEKDLTPFFFATSYLYNGDQYAGSSTYLQANIEEWYQLASGKASRKDIGELLYQTSPLRFFEEKKELAGTNSFMRFLLKPSNAELYRYFELSKKVEDLTSNPDPWEEEHFASSPANAVVDSLELLRRETRNPFIRLRCAYQVIRLYNYTAQEDLVDPYFDSLLAPVKTKSWVKAGALYQVAVNHTGIQRSYLMSKVFDMGSYNRSFCLVKFTAADYDSCLRLAKNSHERTVLLAMKLFNNPGRSLDGIKKLYATESHYAELPFLLLREINKVEDWLLTAKVTDFGGPAVYNGEFWANYEYMRNAAVNYRADRAYAQQLSSFIHGVIAEKRQGQQALMQLYAAYVDLLNGDLAGSAEHIEAASLQRHLPPNVKTQIAIHRFLLSLEKGLDAGAEAQFMKLMQTPEEALGLNDAKLMKNQLVLYTARKMIRSGDRARGLLLLGQTNRALGQLPIGAYKTVDEVIAEEAKEEDYFTMIRILDKKRKTSFERFATGSIHVPWEDDEWVQKGAINWNRNKLKDALASYYIRNYRLSAAARILKQIPENFWQQEPYVENIGGDPFYLNIYRSHSIDSVEKRNLNKRQVVEEMIALRNEVNKDGNKAATAAYGLANAWYNMTWYGKNWLMVKRWWTIDEPDTYEVILKKTPFNDDYYGCRQAQYYYRKARRLTKDKKLAALCFFMERQCESNYRYYTSLAGGKEDVVRNVKPNYALARSAGIDEEYYRQIVEECETYLSFVGKYSDAIGNRHK